jgi:hypothetical protein
VPDASNHCGLVSCLTRHTVTYSATFDLDKNLITITPKCPFLPHPAQA